MKPPFPHSNGGSNADMTPMPKMPSSGTGSNGAGGMKKVPMGGEVRSRGPKGGKPPSKGTTAGLSRGTSS